MKKKAIFFSGSFQYGVVDDFIDGLIAGLSDSYFFEVVDLSNKDYLISLDFSKFFEDVELIFSVNALGVEFSLHYPVVAGIPFYTLLLDHPIHSITRFYGAKVKLLCVDECHVDFVKALGMSAIFFPHGAKASYIDSGDRRNGMAEKSGILFPATYFNSSELREQLSKYFPNALDIIDCNSIDNFTDFLKCLGFMVPGVSPSIELNANSIAILQRCDLYLRAKEREQLLLDFANAGISVTVIGRGWESSRKISIHKYLNAVSFHELLILMKNSKFILHQSPGFKRGLHERVTYPLLTGTMVLTKNDPYLFEIFGESNGIVNFKYTSGVSDLFRNLDMDSYAHSIERAVEIIKKKYTWEGNSRKLFLENISSKGV